MPAPKVFPKSTWDRFTQQLDALPERPAAERGLAVREAVRQIASNISAARARGYSLEQIIELAKSNGIDISTGTLKLAMRDARRPSGKPVQPRTSKPAGTTRTVMKRDAAPTAPAARQRGSDKRVATRPAVAVEMATDKQATRATFSVQPDTDDL
jgi:hypothetical protein